MTHRVMVSFVHEEWARLSKLATSRGLSERELVRSLAILASREETA